MTIILPNDILFIFKKTGENMAIPLTGNGGKGSAPRKNSNQSKYAENWDKIFGKKDSTTESKQDKIVSQ